MKILLNICLLFCFSSLKAQIDSFFIHPGCAEAEPLNPLKSDEFRINTAHIKHLIERKKCTDKTIAELLQLENDTSLCIFSGETPPDGEKLSSYVEICPRTTKRFVGICIINALYFEDMRYLEQQPYIEKSDSQTLFSTRDWDRRNDKLALIASSCGSTKDIYGDVYINCHTQPAVLKEVYQSYHIWYKKMAVMGFRRSQKKGFSPHLLMPLYYKWNFVNL